MQKLGNACYRCEKHTKELMNTQKFLPYAQQFIFPEDIEEVRCALSKPMITRGPLVEAFEHALASYCGAKYGVAFTNCTAGLMAAYHAAKIGPADSFFTTPNTFVASMGAGIQHGATPIFLDIDRNTGNLDLDQLALNIDQPKSRGKKIVVPVHFSGIPVDVEAIEKMLKSPESLIIEDAAHALGSHYKNGTKVGCCAKSDMTVFSFHPAKNITTGEGGMVMTNDEELYHQLQLFRNNGIERDPKFLQGQAAPWYYEVVDLTGNYNFTEMQAALGLSQLKHLDLFIAKRHKLMQQYRQKLASIENIRLFEPNESYRIAYHICVVQINFAAYKKTRTDVMTALKERGIGTQVHYIPVYRHPFFEKSAGDISEFFPAMETYYAQALTLPLFYAMEEEDVDRVVTSLREVLHSF